MHVAVVKVENTAKVITWASIRYKQLNFFEQARFTQASQSPKIQEVITAGVEAVLDQLDFLITSNDLRRASRKFSAGIR
jgi:hypothetical protein